MQNVKKIMMMLALGSASFLCWKSVLASSTTIPVQGYIVDENGEPVSQDTVMYFRLYSTCESANPIASFTKTVSFSSGLLFQIQNKRLFFSHSSLFRCSGG